MTDTSGMWMTPETHQRLQDELAERTGTRRREITDRIEAARAEGDLRENGGYHAAKEDQGKNEARIRQLLHLLEGVQVGIAPVPEDGRVTQGQIVTVRFSDGDEETFLLGSREEAPSADVEVFSPASPLGKAVVDRAVGDEVTYQLPSGKSVSVEIIATKTYRA